jgi:GT2 family glycosyltransferase
MTQLTPQAEVPEKQTPRISVIIVSLNRIESLRASLNALGAEHQVIVVDNGSVDGAENIVDEFPHILVHSLPRNFGLTKALNIGLRAAEGEYLLWLHDDASISADAVTRLADYLESHTEAGAVCPLLTDAAGSPVPQVRSLPTPSDPDPALRLPPDGKETDAEELTVDATSCAAIMFRSFFLRALRHVDEHYGTYGPSIEIPMQVRRANKKVVILHSVTAIHEKLPSPVPPAELAGDRAAGTAVYLGKHHGFTTGIVYRLKTAISALFTLRFSVLMGVISGQKTDGTR